MKKISIVTLNSGRVGFFKNSEAIKFAKENNASLVDTYDGTIIKDSELPYGCESAECISNAIKVEDKYYSLSQTCTTQQIR